MKHNNHKRTLPPAATCWQREAPSACVRVEISGRETFLFPYNHLVSASLSVGDDEAETLLLAFSSHDVEITGRNLRGLLSALQDFAVKWMRAIPQRYQALETGDDGVISRIKVEEAK
jgi:hypothetical protein